MRLMHSMIKGMKSRAIVVLAIVAVISLGIDVHQGFVLIPLLSIVM